MPLVPESRPRRHPLLGHLQVSPLRTQSTTPSTGHGLQGRPNWPPVSLRRLALTAYGARASGSPARSGVARSEVPAGRRGRRGPGLTSHRSWRPPAGRARTRAPPPGAQPCRRARARGARGARGCGELCVPGSPGRLRRGTRSGWDAQGAARSRAGLRRAGRAPPAASRRGEVLRREPRRPRGGARREGDAPRSPAALPVPPASCPGRAPGLAPPLGPRGWGRSGAGTPRASSVGHEWPLPRGCGKSCEHSLEEGELGEPA